MDSMPCIASRRGPNVETVRAILQARPMSADQLADVLNCRYDEIQVILNGWPEFESVVQDWQTVWRTYAPRPTAAEPAATPVAPAWGGAIVALAIIGVCGAITLLLLTDLVYVIR